MSLSIRGRLVLGIATLVACGLTIATVSGVVLLREYLSDRVDIQLAGLSPAGSPPGGRDLCAPGRSAPQLRTDFVVAILDEGGQRECYIGDPDVPTAPEIPTLTYREVSANPDLTLTTVSADGDSRWRLNANPVPDQRQVVVTAVSLADIDGAVARLTQISAATGVGILALTAAAGFLITGLGLRPLHRIGESAERIADGDLSERVPDYRPNTEVGRLSLSLNRMLTQIEQAFRERAASEERLRQFVADASHELRTPIATIRGHAELHRAGIATSSDDVAMVLDRVESEAQRMGTLVDDMLLLARLDQARPLEQRPVDLLAIAADTVIDAHARQPERSITLETDASEDAVPPVVTGDAARLRQVVTNLISNGLRHTHANTPIEVRVGSRDGRAVLSVKDEGRGMSADVVDRVFQRFYRGDSSRGREHGGTGLGLAIVDALVAAHGGTATCASEPGRGSTFTISIPLERQQEQPRTGSP